ncbi:hypothetical protein DRP04_03935 [Archaeoglobales archaeon]|nr:MAG: hypothetical protein DRP04_03935 [Archaeoglobales archaeon]
MTKYRFIIHYSSRIGSRDAEYFSIDSDYHVLDYFKVGGLPENETEIVDRINVFIQDYEFLFQPAGSISLKDFDEELNKYFIFKEFVYDAKMIYEKKPLPELVKKALASSVVYDVEGLPPQIIRCLILLHEREPQTMYEFEPLLERDEEILEKWLIKYNPNVNISWSDDSFALSPRDFRSLLLCEFLMTAYSFVVIARDVEDPVGFVKLLMDDENFFEYHVILYRAVEKLCDEGDCSEIDRLKEVLETIEPKKRVRFVLAMIAVM